MNTTGSSTNSHSLVRRLLAALWLGVTVLAGCALFLWAMLRGAGYIGGGLYPDETVAPPFILLSGLVVALGPAAIWFFTRKPHWLYAAGFFVLAGLVSAILYAVASLGPT